MNVHLNQTSKTARSHLHGPLALVFLLIMTIGLLCANKGKVIVFHRSDLEKPPAGSSN